MKLQETIRKVLRETREEKVNKFIYSRFDRVFDELNLEVEYGENDYVYGKWYDKDKQEVFHRNSWGSFWILKCEPYRTLYAISKSVDFDDIEFNEILIEYLNDKYKEQFLNRTFKSVGDELYCLEDESIWN
jgi:hypothetical protein